MIGVRRIRRRLVLSATLVVALSGLGGGSATAATPSWNDSFVTATPPKVSAGANAGYTVTIINSGMSNLSQVFLTEVLQTNDTVPVEAIPPAYLPINYIDQSQGSCEPLSSDGVLYCALGAIRAGRSATVTVAYPTGANATLKRIFEVNTTGVAGDNQGSSHGDVLQLVGTTTIGSSADFSGRFIGAVAPDLIVKNSLVLGTSNRQSTKVTAPGGAIGVNVEDGAGFSPLPCSGCWSETSEIHVNSGTYYDAGFKVEIGIYKTPASAVHGVYHEFDAPRLDADGNVISGESITTTCPKNGTPTASQLPCFSVSKLPGGSISVTVWLHENGRIRFT